MEGVYFRFSSTHVKSSILCEPLGAIDHHTSPLRRGAKMGFFECFSAIL
jgi:hypothetical protein